MNLRSNYHSPDQHILFYNSLPEIQNNITRQKSIFGIRYPKFYTQKEWNRLNRCFEKDFNGIILHKCTQEVLINKYNIILTDYKTKLEQVQKIVNMINIVNLQKGIKKINRFTNSLNVNSTNTKTNDFEFLRTSKKRVGKTVNYSFLGINSPIQKRKKYRKRKTKSNNNEINYSFLTGKKK